MILVAEGNFLRETTLPAMIGTPNQSHGPYTAEPFLILDHQHVGPVPRCPDGGAGAGGAPANDNSVDVCQDGYAAGT